MCVADGSPTFALAYLLFLVVCWFSAPQGRQIAPITVKFGVEGRATRPLGLGSFLVRIPETVILTNFEI